MWHTEEGQQKHHVQKLYDKFQDIQDRKEGLKEAAKKKGAGN